MSTIWGAIRWDFTYRGLGNAAPAGSSLYELASIEPAQFRACAPLHFQSTGPNTGTFADTQATFDGEIAAALTAGLSYWAFLRYGLGSTVTNVAGTYGLAYYQASTNRSTLNWCSMFKDPELGSTGAYSTQIAAAVTEFQQSYYQKVLTNRPLVYIYWPSVSLATNWGNVVANYAAMITALRAATVAAGLGTPYIVVMSGTGAIPAIGADAVSNYFPSVTYQNNCPWATYEPLVEAYWTSMAALGSPIVPICTTGWNATARISKPPNWEQTIKPYMGLNHVVTAPTNAQITTHLTAGVAYINANPTICPAAVGLIYAWDENAECGTPLQPTLGDPTGTRCAAAGTALIGN